MISNLLTRKQRKIARKERLKIYDTGFKKRITKRRKYDKVAKMSRKRNRYV